MAQFVLHHRTADAESGYMDSYLDLYQIRKYLASRYKEARGQKRTAWIAVNLLLCLVVVKSCKNVIATSFSIR